jgi:hypothetical protein
MHQENHPSTEITEKKDIQMYDSPFADLEP